MYFFVPLIAWLVAGSLKFFINCIRANRFAFDLIGYGGFPSNHSAIVASIATICGINFGIASPVFGVAFTLAFIVILDAASLRRQIGRHASALNIIREMSSYNYSSLRERVGHTKFEIFGGVLVGMTVAYAMHFTGLV